MLTTNTIGLIVPYVYSTWKSYGNSSTRVFGWSRELPEKTSRLRA